MGGGVLRRICEVLEVLFLIDEEDENCDLYECPHKIFWKRLGLERHETVTSRRLKNCMLMVDEPIPIRKIGEMYGLPEAGIKSLFLPERHLNRPRPSRTLKKGGGGHERPVHKQP
jgi:hypothetical protein